MARPLVATAALVLVLLSSLPVARPASSDRAAVRRVLHDAAAAGRVTEQHLAQLEAAIDYHLVRQCLAFLVEHMPQADRGVVSPQSLRTNVLLALAAREAHDWAADVPWPVFLNDVLPYANLDEPRDDWRLLFQPLMAPVVANASSITEAAQVLNRDIWAMWGIVFKPHQTPDIMSPSQVIQHGYASCTGLSIFLVDALRSVGIPARVAGTPNWVTAPSAAARAARAPGASRQRRLSSSSGRSGSSRTLGGEPLESAAPRLEPGTAPAAAGADVAPQRSWGDHVYNNHDWVEVWDEDRWSFVGAAEWDARGMNRTWFFPQPAKQQVPGSPLDAIYAASFAPPPLGCGRKVFPLVWNLNYTGVRGCDVTQSYLDAAVLDDQQQRRAP